MFFFFFNDEERIGFKKLTSADLGFSETSHQSHIGLYEGVLEFLDDTNEVKSAMLIYEDYCNILDCTFDRIKNQDGSYRSPKIRIGDDPDNSVVSAIRHFAATNPNEDWYLAWMGLESKELVFWLIKSNSKEYEIARNLFQGNKVLNKESSTYNEAKDYFLKRINFVSINVQKDIEVSSLVGNKKNRYKDIDLEKAAQNYKEIGKMGEELIAQYLDKEKAAKRINSYTWENKSTESFLPYDFIIDNNLYVDVKSTRFDFKQYLFFSNQEIGFAASKCDSNYAVYRVYDMEKKQKLVICNNCQSYMESVQKPIKDFEICIQSKNAKMERIQLGISPCICFKKISKPILL